MCVYLPWVCGFLWWPEEGVSLARGRVSSSLCCLSWVLGVELESSGRIACALNN